MKLRELLYRSWYYFRVGYSTYIAFFIGFFGNIVVIYKLGIEPVLISNSFPILQNLFPHLSTFVAATLIILVPISIYSGHFHMKRTGAYAAETSIGVESNPYVYKVAPGKEQEVFLPLMMLTAKGLAKVMDQQQAMSAEEKKEFSDIMSKANKLLAGQVVGLPRQRDFLKEARKADRI